MRAPQQKTNRQWDPPDGEWLNHQYWILQKSSRTMGDEVGVNRSTIRRWMSKLGVSRRSPTEAALLRPKCRLGHSRSYLSRVARKVMLEAGVPEQCEVCGRQDSLIIHHKNEDPENNECENLMRLCQSCHVRIHRRSFPKGVF